MAVSAAASALLAAQSLILQEFALSGDSAEAVRANELQEHRRYVPLEQANLL